MGRVETTANGLAQEWRHATDDAAGARELLSEDGDDPELRELLETSEARIAELTRRSGSRWSSATPTTTRT